MASLLERLGVNVASVVIGALVFIIAITWVEAFLALTEHVIFDGGLESKQVVNKKILSAVFVSVASGAIAVIIYYYYSQRAPKTGDDDEVDVDDFVALVDLFNSEQDVAEAIGISSPGAESVAEALTGSSDE